MTKGRSPNYPQVPLDEACGRARRVYQAEHTHVAPREVVARALGYNSMNGSALAALSTLRQYGLLAQTGAGLKISDDAVSVLELPEGDAERTAALRRLAFTPSLFKELNEKFGDTLPSDVNLRHYLIKEKKFLPNAADQVIRVYRANLELVGSNNVSYNEADQAKSAQNGGHAAEQASPERQAGKFPASLSSHRGFPDNYGFMATPAVQHAPLPQSVAPLAEGETELKFNISQSSKARIVFSGQVTQEAVEKLITLLETQKDTFPSSRNDALQQWGNEALAELKPEGVCGVSDFGAQTIDDKGSQTAPYGWYIRLRCNGQLVMAKGSQFSLDAKETIKNEIKRVVQDCLSNQS
jgi:hypothetical protein